MKLVVTGDADVADRFELSLRAVADRQNCVIVCLSAETTKAHMIDQVFFAVARQIDWDTVAVAILGAAYDEIAIPAAPGRLTVAEVAADHDLPRAAASSANNPSPTDCHAERSTGSGAPGQRRRPPGEARVVQDWLTGEPVGLRELRDAMIYARIGRHNARTMLTSVGRLLLRAGHRGLVLHLDLTRLAEARRPPLPERTGIYYSKAAVLDAYELLRQLIDATDDLVGMLVVAVVPPELVSDEKRGLPSYAALQLRVADEVRDRRRTNPFASLVRLDVRLEAVR